MVKILESPFRYPGAKSRFLNLILERISPCISSNSVFVEPFVGGGSVFLGACQKLAKIKRFVIADIDKAIIAFWSCMWSPMKFRNIVKKIETVPLTVEEHARQKSILIDGLADDIVLGFSAIYMNRTSFSGIMTAGPIGGQNQKSRYTVGCRFNRNKLIEKLKNIRIHIRGRAQTINQDFEKTISDWDIPEAVIYCDPPYFHKGDQLYRHKMDYKDHVRLSNCLKTIKNAQFFLSYDDAKEIRMLYDWACTETIEARYSISGHGRKSWEKKTELLVSRI